MNRALSQWIFGVIDDTTRSALMLALAGVAISLQERPRSQRQASGDTGQVFESLQVLSGGGSDRTTALTVAATQAPKAKL